MIYLPSFSTRINWENYISRVTDQKFFLAVMSSHYFTTKWWQMHKWYLIPQSCSGGVYRMLAMKPARMLKELSQYFSRGIRANKWDILITRLLCRSEINFKVYSQVIALTIKVQNQFYSKMAMCFPYVPMTSLRHCCCCCQVASVVSDSVWSHRRQPTRLLSLGFSRQDHWSGLPFPSPRHESEK